MRSLYKPLREFIEEINCRDNTISIERLLGVSIQKKFIPSIANTIGTDMSTYKIIRKNQFAYGPVTSRNGNRISIALLEEFGEAIVSQAYTVFQTKDSNLLMPQYLNMWFKRSEFDRYARFMSHGSAREIFGWEELCDTLIPVPSIEKQLQSVNEFNAIQNRILLNQKIIKKLEEISQCLYRQWFVDFEFPDAHGLPYKSNGGEMIWSDELEQEIPRQWKVGSLEDLIDFSNGYGFESDELLDEESDDCFSVFKMGNIHKGGGLRIDGTKSWIPKKDCANLDRFILKKGDLLMCMTDMKENIGLLGNTALMTVDDKFIVNQRVGLLRSKNAFGISCRQLYLLTNSTPFLRDLRSRANRGVQVNLTTGEIVGTKVLIADEMTNLAFDKILKPIFEKIDRSVADKKNCEQVSEAVLSKLSTIN